LFVTRIWVTFINPPRIPSPGGRWQLKTQNLLNLIETQSDRSNYLTDEKSVQRIRRRAPLILRAVPEMAGTLRGRLASDRQRPRSFF